jgi:excisionase family DNA binding protein
MTTQISLGAAARQLGVSKGTISKAIASGKLSATRREDNSWAIENAELARYVEAHGHRFRPEAVAGKTVVGLRARAELAEQRLADLRHMLADMERQRDKWETVATWLSLPAPKPDEKPPSWWRWLRAG